MKMQDLTHKVAVITGASSGIGEASARLLAAEGMKVILVARRKERLEKLAQEIGASAYVFPADLRNPEEVRHLFEVIGNQYQGIDLLFNNAGLGYNAPFVESKASEWEEMIEANLYGVLRCTHAAIPLMRGRPGAMISTVSSVGGRYGLPGWSVYNATKFAVVGFHDALRKELGPEGIRVALIEPGAVWTEWGFNVPEESMRERRQSLEALHPEDVAQALVYSFAQPAHVLVEEILVRPVKQIVP